MESLTTNGSTSILVYCNDIGNAGQTYLVTLNESNYKEVSQLIQRKKSKFIYSKYFFKSNCRNLSNKISSISSTTLSKINKNILISLSSTMNIQRKTTTIQVHNELRITLDQNMWVNGRN